MIDLIAKAGAFFAAHTATLQMGVLIGPRLLRLGQRCSDENWEPQQALSERSLAAEAMPSIKKCTR
jgi:hypothetical protein